MRSCASMSTCGWVCFTAWITSSNLLSRYNFCRELVARAKGVGRARDGRDAAAPPRRPVRGQRFSTYGLVRAAGTTDAEAIVRLLERRFLAIPLTASRRTALVDFLAGADGSEPLDMQSLARAERKLDECLHLLTTAPEFQIL